MTEILERRKFSIYTGYVEIEVDKIEAIETKYNSNKVVMQVAEYGVEGKVCLTDVYFKKYVKKSCITLKGY